jgi:hypothetical protein
MTAHAGILAYVHDMATGDGGMAYFNNATIPVIGDRIVLERSGPMPAGEYRVNQRRISAVGENEQRVDLYLSLIGDVPKDWSRL